MVWGDFLIQKLKRELLFLGDHIPKILTAAFLCSCGGILLWVNGTNLWYVLSSRSVKFTIPIAGAFCLCLLTYALCGAILALLLTFGITFCSNTRYTGIFFIAFAVHCAVYLLLLAWYAIFFCTHLTLFALILLLLTFVFTILVYILVRRQFLILRLLLLILAGLELYFITINFRLI